MQAPQGCEIHHGRGNNQIPGFLKTRLVQPAQRVAADTPLKIPGSQYQCMPVIFRQQCNELFTPALVAGSVVRRQQQNAWFDTHQGSSSPLLCQKEPVFSRFSLAICSTSPRADSSGVIRPPKFTIRVFTKPGCSCATAIPLGFKSIARDLPKAFNAALDAR